MTALIYFPGSDKRDSDRTEVGHKLTAHKSTTDKHGCERERQTDRTVISGRRDRQTETDRQTDRDADTEELFIFSRNKSETKMTAF